MNNIIKVLVDGHSYKFQNYYTGVYSEAADEFIFSDINTRVGRFYTQYKDCTPYSLAVKEVADDPTIKLYNLSLEQRAAAGRRLDEYFLNK